MPLNWDDIGSGTREPLIRPRDIYASLPNRPWPYLRQEQGEVLERWFTRRDDHDIVVKQNTGGGKTVAGLLIAQSTLNEEVGKAIYLAPDTYLATRVRQEATRLGLSTTTRHDDPEFLGQDAILVTTFQKLVNGRSVFGVTGDGREPIDLGVVIVDDAHAALATTESQFRLTVPPDHEAYTKIIKLFAGDLQEQSPKSWEDIRSGDFTALARIPFWTWADRAPEVVAILHRHRAEEKFKFEWPLVADVIHLCAATVTTRGLELRPPCPPIGVIPSFVRAKRRVYLTATLADDSILVTDLNADPALLEQTVTPGSAADLGDRMILSPIALNPTLTDDAVRSLAKGFATGDRNGDGAQEAPPLNVVVVVPSKAAVEPWAPFADRVHYVGDLEDGVAELAAGHVGLVVLVNKYDGVDLPGDACRLLVLDGVPAPMDGQERRESAILANSRRRRAREVQRIEQGMGRGVRDVDDYCAVLLMGATLGVATHDKDWQTLFSPATRAQLELSRDVAVQLKGQGLDALRDALSACLDRDEQWVRRSRRALAEIRYDDAGAVSPVAIAQRQAFDLATAGQTVAAAERLQHAINQVDDPSLRGWLREQKAAYLQFTDSVGAQAQLTAAIHENPLVLRPASGVRPNRLRAAAVQARAAAEFLGETYDEGVSLVLGVRALLDQIAWDEDRTVEAEGAWEQLGLHLGFGSSRPEKLYGTGPDNLWAMASTRDAVVELKTGCTTDSISKKDLDQLGGSVRWSSEQHPEATAVPVIVHPSRAIHPQGVAVPGMRIITPDRLHDLKRAVTATVVALADGAGRWADESAVATQFAEHSLTAASILDRYAEAPLVET